jgi:hypothetical protein
LLLLTLNDYTIVLRLLFFLFIVCLSESLLLKVSNLRGLRRPFEDFCLFWQLNLAAAWLLKAFKRIHCFGNLQRNFIGHGFGQGDFVSIALREAWSKSVHVCRCDFLPLSTFLICICNFEQLMAPLRRKCLMTAPIDFYFHTEPRPRPVDKFPQVNRLIQSAWLNLRI